MEIRAVPLVIKPPGIFGKALRGLTGAILTRIRKAQFGALEELGRYCGGDRFIIGHAAVNISVGLWGARVPCFLAHQLTLSQFFDKVRGW